MKQLNQQFLDEWNFYFSQSGLSPSAEIDKIGEECKLFRVPSMIFASNNFIIKHTKNNLKITYNAKQALRFLNYNTRQETYSTKEQPPMPNTISYLPRKLQIVHAAKWKNLQKPKDVEISQIADCSDSFFITPFKGHISGECTIQRVQGSVIPLQKLGPHNVMTFYHQGSLYEDELDDNGLIQYEYKFRAMAESWFALIRCYARVDHVTVIVMDTRLYWQKGQNRIGRQFMVKEADWQSIKQKQTGLQKGWAINPNQSHLLYPHLQEVFVENQYIIF